MYKKRKIAELLHKALESFPAVLITGSRQTGKTTLLRNELPDIPYITFDDPLERDYATTDPKGFLEQFSKGPVILDEIQYVPNLFSYLKINIDESRHSYGKWIMTGSQQFQVMRTVSDSLAGRIAVMELYPFSVLEEPVRDSLSMRLWKGGYPEPLLYQDDPYLWLSSYLTTYIERDIRQLKNISDLNLFQHFMGICAANHGQELNYATISRKCGMSQPVCKDWISVLSASYILKLLPPFYNNFGKRLIKSPKMYFIDSAIVAFMTRHLNAEILLSGPMAGEFFEGFIVSELFKYISFHKSLINIFFWRSHDGLEVDMILEKDGRLIPVEVKNTSTPSLKHSQPIERFRAFCKGIDCSDGIIVCNSKKEIILPNNVRVMNWQTFFRSLEKL